MLEEKQLEAESAREEAEARDEEMKRDFQEALEDGDLLRADKIDKDAKWSKAERRDLVNMALTTLTEGRVGETCDRARIIYSKYYKALKGLCRPTGALGILDDCELKCPE